VNTAENQISILELLGEDPADYQHVGVEGGARAQYLQVPGRDAAYGACRATLAAIAIARLSAWGSVA
jgi:hypothetical protein